MTLRHLIGPLGTLTAITFGLALLNFFVKFINKKYISKLGKDQKHFIDLYRKFMKLIVKYHKFIGIISVSLLSIHFYTAFSSNRISTTGIISAIIMLVLFLLGIYGAYINRTIRGNWLKVHRVLAFLLLISIVIHTL
jgi:hypothetical protein